MKMKESIHNLIKDETIIQILKTNRQSFKITDNVILSIKNITFKTLKSNHTIFEALSFSYYSSFQNTENIKNMLLTLFMEMISNNVILIRFDL